jgi:pyridoxine kinase
VLGSCDAVLSGYLGSADIGHAVVGAVAQVRAANPGAVYCCDPVIGDVGRGVFVRPGIADFLRDVAVPVADVVTPNHFELDLLSGRTTRTLDEVKDAVAAVQALGPQVVLTTSLVAEDTPDDAVDLLASAGGRHVRVRTPRLDLSVNGAGDAIAALFLAHWLASRSVDDALGRAAASVYGLLRRTAEAGSREVLLVAAQEEFVSPSRTFAVEEV